MATITFGIAHRAENIRGQLKAGLVVLSEGYDTFVRYRMRLAAAGHVIAIDRRAMIAVQPTCSYFSRRQAPGRAIERESERSGMPADEPAIVTAHFRPLDSSIVNETIPAFFIGRNKEGLWVARDVKGRIGGIFLLEKSAVSFARRNSRPAGCVTIFSSGKLELDLENKGNPLVVHLGSLMHATMRPRQRMAAFIGKMMEAVKRRLNDLHIF